MKYEMFTALLRPSLVLQSVRTIKDESSPRVNQIENQGGRSVIEYLQETTSRTYVDQIFDGPPNIECIATTRVYAQANITRKAITTRQCPNCCFLYYIQKYTANMMVIGGQCSPIIVDCGQGCAGSIWIQR